MGNGGRLKEKGGGERNQKPNSPLSLILHPQVFEQLDLGVEKGVCWWGKGTLRQQTS